ncbi:hypothetical protein [Micromonospora zhanjiangensis]|uniref:Membrane-anchored ribosome-binding protein, inhibits growth in stationary phase, ElaB/YqjD/DUF883 family n=1 Tax=Micromonospora zhanjiangensis TaxID=1522057 RepID=A0ABV8KHZ5_9ACTN
MFGTNLLERRSRTERIADQAWQHLVAAVTSAGDTVRDTARDTARSAKLSGTDLADEARDRVGSAADEAWQRATRAFDALAGRRPSLPWGLLIGAGLIGAAVGWAAGTAARTALARGDRELTSEQVEFVDVDRPSSPMSLDN